LGIKEIVVITKEVCYFYENKTQIVIQRQMINQNIIHIFINYRRVLCKAEAHIIRNELGKVFGLDAVFLYYKDITLGDKWENRIEHHLNKATVMLSLIPKQWLEITHPEFGGQRRIDLPDDWVRKEIRYSIVNKKIIIPVQIEGGLFPDKKFLPADIQEFASFQSASVDLRVENIEYEILKIVRAIERIHNINSSTVENFSYPKTASFHLPTIFDTSTFFDKKIPYTRYCKLSCNRDDELIQLKEHLGNNKKTSAIHYFIGGRYGDRIESLIERFIIDIQKTHTVEYKTQNARNKHILQVEELPIAFDLAGSQSIFKAYFEDRFSLKKMLVKINTLADLQQSNLPILQKNYCVFVFQIHKNKKHQFFKNYIQWIIEDFCKGQTSNSQFLFFYTFIEQPFSHSSIIDFFRRKKQESIKRKLEIFLRMKSNCFFLSELSWVTVGDIINWFDEYTFQIFKAEEYIEKAKKEAKYKYYYDKKTNSFSMHIVEELIRNIIEQEAPSAL
jgi:hypothetical protein